ncbi:MAG: UvrD-helicase domain-containing protein [Clostridiales bacterium]|nr:UvrD-helicase domain-containing protein [Clostridiales bacterium]
MMIADLHIHSKYSLATSRDCDAPHLDLWARYKGIHLVGTGDFTHPQWRKELQIMLTPAEEGLWQLKNEYRLPGEVALTAAPVDPLLPADPRFVLSAEISTIYKRNGKTRKVHHVILVPSMEDAESLSHKLEAIGNLHSDGRPILGIDSHDLLEILLDTCPQAVYIPAHIWTPHFSLFGAFSGFETLEECYGDLASYVHAVETGLSSDPAMNRRVSLLDRLTLVSNSDAHSPAKLGREANLLRIAPSYPALAHAIQTGEGMAGTLEFFPEEGKYHLDGHRACGLRQEPEETLRTGGRCPVCGKKVTVGVLHRIEEMADRPAGFVLPAGKPFESLIPLPEVIAASTGSSAVSKKTQERYFAMLRDLGPEFTILRDLPTETIEASAGHAIGEGIRRLRAGKVDCLAGYDGEYGTISLFAPGELEVIRGQVSMLGINSIGKRKPREDSAAWRGEKGKADEKASPIVLDRNPSMNTPLNPQQAQAVMSTVPTLAVIAGPGTGKTKTLVERLAHLLEEERIPPSSITAVTFTNQAAEEMRLRLETRLGGKARLRGLTIGTFHSICLQLLDPKPILDPSEALRLMERILTEHGSALAPATCLGMISTVKNGQSIRSAGLSQVLYNAYQAELVQRNIRDLDDLLLDALTLDPHENKRFTHLLVDEFQDINPVQHRLIRHWSEHGQSLFVIGDPDQSIYGFRGANAKCFEELKTTLPRLETITLRHNYRSTPAILQGALALIRHNPGEVRMLEPHRKDVAPIRLMTAEKPFDAAIWVAKDINRMVGGMDMVAASWAERQRQEIRSFSDIAVLCRTRHQLALMESCLRHESIPCVIYGRDDFLTDPAVAGTIGFFRFLLEPRDTVSLETCLQRVWRVPSVLIQRAVSWAMEQSNLKVEAARQALSSFDGLLPWLDLVDIFLPRVEKEKPRKLLQQWVDIRGKNPAMEQLLHASVFHEDMSSFLSTLLLGEDVDLRRLSGSRTPREAVKLMTIHGSKGLEFPVVFLSADAFPLAGDAPDASKTEEERRLFFVGMTRAKDELIVTASQEDLLFVAEIKSHAQRGRIPGRKQPERAEQLSLI